MEPPEATTAETALSVFVSPADLNGLNGLSQRTIFEDFLGDLRRLDDCDIFVHTDPVHEEWVRDRLPDSERFTLELDGPPGRSGLPGKVQKRLNRHFENGYGRVLALAADTPGLGTRQIQTALRQLDRTDSTAVVGPSDDGGFYLLGLNRPRRDLLEGVPFYVENTFRCLRRNLDCYYSRVRTLETLRDVDRVSDWFQVQFEWLDPFRWLLRILHRIRFGDTRRSSSSKIHSDNQFAFLSRTHRSPPVVA